MIFNARNTIALLLILLAAAGCRKEKTPAPTHLDENYLVVKDNPDDAVDHQLYLFFQSTGIPGFYNDSVGKKQVGVSSTGVPQYTYQLLTLSYSPLGTAKSGVVATAYKQRIPAILDLMKTAVLPKLPAGIFIPSILFVDSIWFENPVFSNDPSTGWDAYHGFNTIAIKCRDVSAMNADQKRMYVASLLAGISAKKIMNTLGPRMQHEFFTISRDLAMPEFGMDVYNSYPLEFIFPVFPEPEHFGFTQYLAFVIKADGFEGTFTVAPREEDDLRIFLTAALYYTTEEFNAKYAAHAAIRDKFRILKEIAAGIGLQFPG